MCIDAFADSEPKNTILHKTNTRTNSREQKKPSHQSFVYLRIGLPANKITALLLLTGDLVCMPLLLFGFSFLVVIEIGSLARLTCFSNVDLSCIF